jgi:hypothetical protein
MGQMHVSRLSKFLGPAQVPQPIGSCFIGRPGNCGARAKHSRTTRDDVPVPIEDYAVSTKRDRANDGEDPNRHFSSIPGGVREPRLDRAQTTRHRDARHDVRRNHPSPLDDTGQHAP